MVVIKERYLHDMNRKRTFKKFSIKYSIFTIWNLLHVWKVCSDLNPESSASCRINLVPFFIAIILFSLVFFQRNLLKMIFTGIKSNDVKLRWHRLLIDSRVWHFDGQWKDVAVYQGTVKQNKWVSSGKKRDLELTKF